jgi:hypothetical protein
VSPGLPTVYLDVTIPSFYYEDRPAIILQAWREITAQFWDSAPGRYELLTSDETIRELQDPAYPEAKRILLSRSHGGCASSRCKC